jgi:hypothetical protein
LEAADDAVAVIVIGYEGLLLVLFLRGSLPAVTNTVSKRERWFYVPRVLNEEVVGSSVVLATREVPAARGFRLPSRTARIPILFSKPRLAA